MEQTRWNGSELKEACVKASKSIENLCVAFSRLNKKEFVHKSKFHK